MSRLKAAFALLVALVATPAAAQIAGTPYEVSGQAGHFHYDTRSRLRSGPAFAGSIGRRFTPAFVLEATALFGPAKTDTLPKGKRNFSYLGVDMRWNLRPAEARVVPYVLIGAGIGQSHAKELDPAKLQRGSGSLGLGALFNIRNQRTWLRLQVRDIWFQERSRQGLGNQFAATAGLHFLFGGKPRDMDLDGVRDWLDQCPGTPIGATVDARGCPQDADRDSVFDGIDECPNTPLGCKVDRKGCPSDADGDGVCDGVDQCADTPKGASVDDKGCPNDSDGDGVVNGVDQCENTPAGCQVDERGCPKDADGDGVCDGLDQCPATGPGLKVDPAGCPIELIERETELLDTGMIRLQDVNFATAKADILPESHAPLDVVGAVLGKWPQLRIEIGGHTDSRGSNAYNQRLSEARAGSVLAYLRQKYPNLEATQFSVRGYGESRPLVPDTNDLNMAKNRRVEFVVQNKDVLKREVERRRLLPKEVIAPHPAPLDTLPQPIPARPDSTR